MSVNRFKGSKTTKKIKFVGQDLEIVKLTVAQALKVQDAVKDAENNEAADANLGILLLVLQQGAPDLSDMTMEDLKDFPMNDLTLLSADIMKFSGMTGEKDK
jgi:hypothetical protein